MTWSAALACIASALVASHTLAQTDIAVGAEPRAPGMPLLHEPPLDLPRRAGRSPRTWKDMRDHGVVRQGFDYSCGSAALATLLAGTDPDISEREILLEVLDGLTEEQKRVTMEQGLSLLNLKTVATRRGHRAEGYRVDPDFLLELTRPVIVFIKPGGYRHFAVLRGVRGDRIFLADPARGNIRVPAFKFLEMWLEEDGKGVIFVVGAESAPLLALAADAPTQPELLAVRQLMNIGPLDVHQSFPR